MFIDYLIYAGLDTKIQAGKHTVNPQMNALEIAQELIDSTPEDVIFGLLPGWRVEEIAALLPGQVYHLVKQIFFSPFIIHPLHYHWSFEYTGQS